MKTLATTRLPVSRDAVAPDGSDVGVVLELAGGAMAHFELGPAKTSKAVTHRTVEEIWFFVTGTGQMWRKQGDDVEITHVSPGVCLTIPRETHFHSDTKPWWRSE
jgi:mannose-6-phosphate isomerase-like protein (cupin superfamily)